MSSTLSITELCELLNRSRTWFYKWKRRYELYGKEGLRNIDRSPPSMPNRTPLDIEMNILDFIITYLTYYPVRISNEPTRQNVKVKPSAVYNVLKRHKFNNSSQKLLQFDTIAFISLTLSTLASLDSIKVKGLNFIYAK